MLISIRPVGLLPRCYMRKTSLRKLKYWVSDFLANLFLTYCIVIFRGLSLKTIVFISKILGRITFFVHKKYRERVIENLSTAFGEEKDLNEIKSLAREVFFHFTLTALETIFLIANPFDRFLTQFRIEGREYLDAALAKRRGVIVLGAHLGSFTLLGMRLALEGYPINLISDMGNFPRVTKLFYDNQRRHGQKPFPSKPASIAIKKSLNCLRRNEILYLIADEQQRRGGLPVSFFGKTAYSPPGPAIFSLKTGAPILPMLVLREKGIPQTLWIGSPIEIERTSDGKKDTELLTAKFTKAIEDAVRQYPSQWTWLNRRWKLPFQKGESSKTEKSSFREI